MRRDDDELRIFKVNLFDERRLPVGTAVSVAENESSKSLAVQIDDDFFEHQRDRRRTDGDGPDSIGMFFGGVKRQRR